MYDTKFYTSIPAPLQAGAEIAAQVLKLRDSVWKSDITLLALCRLIQSIDDERLASAKAWIEAELPRREANWKRKAPEPKRGARLVQGKGGKKK